MKADKKFRVEIDIEILRGYWSRNIPVGEFIVQHDAQKSLEFIKCRYPCLAPHIALFKQQR